MEDEKEQNKGAIDLFFSFSFKRPSFLFLLFFKRREDGEKKRKRGQKKSAGTRP